ncbi:MAG: hypothetical protein JWQ25_2940 [Daejeonella sp.]|nr:hypothetical protein [Daejeonella sp.]
MFFTGLGGLSGTAAYAQKSNPDLDVNMWMQHPVVVDGNSEEWHEPLNNFNSETKLAFALGNDKQNLYLIIESLDEVTTGRLIRGGLTLNINTLGKKKDGIKLNFLGMKHPAPPHGELKDSTFRHVEKGEHDPGVRAISVSGFKNIVDGSLVMPNNAGIQVAAAFNKHKDYICELAIPLAQLNLNGKEAKGITYQIKINSAGGNPERRHEGGQGVEDGGTSRRGGMGGGGGRKGGSGGMGGGGGGRKGGGGGMGSRKGDEGSVDSSKSDFWIKYQLAKPDESSTAN